MVTAPLSTILVEVKRYLHELVAAGDNVFFAEEIAGSVVAKGRCWLLDCIAEIHLGE